MNIIRYNLALPRDMYENLCNFAKKNNTTILELIRKFIKIGFILTDESIEKILLTDKSNNTTEVKIIL